MFIPYACAETLDQMAAGLRDYRAAFIAAGGRAADATAPFGFHAYCAETTAQARAEARDASWSATCARASTRCSGRSRPWSSRTWSRSAIPTRSLRVARRYEAAGFTHFLAIANFGGLPHKRVLRSMELMARHVLPRLGP